MYRMDYSLLLWCDEWINLFSFFISELLVGINKDAIVGTWLWRTANNNLILLVMSDRICALRPCLSPMWCTPPNSLIPFSLTPSPDQAISNVLNAECVVEKTSNKDIRVTCIFRFPWHHFLSWQLTIENYIFGTRVQSEHFACVCATRIKSNLLRLKWLKKVWVQITGNSDSDGEWIITQTRTAQTYTTNTLSQPTVVHSTEE